MKRYYLSFFKAYVVSWLCLWVVVLGGFLVRLLETTPLWFTVAGCVLLALPFPLFGMRNGPRDTAEGTEKAERTKSVIATEGTEKPEKAEERESAIATEGTEKSEGAEITENAAGKARDRRALLILLAVMFPLSLLDASGISPFLSTPGRMGLSFEDAAGIPYGSMAEALLILPTNLLFPLLFHWGWRSHLRK